MRLTACLFTASLVSLLALPAQAQDFALEPTYGTATLEAGFPNDPASVQLQSGGSIDAATLGGACKGFIADAPDYRVNYAAGNFPLIFVAIADVDTTLVINAPDGSWYCDDDSDGNLDPRVTFGDPASGQYDVWVGTYASASIEDATLFITELPRNN
jgi:hypothetical protein